MKITLLLFFALIFAPSTFAQDSLGSAIESLRAAEKEAGGEKEELEDEDEFEEDFEEEEFEEDWDVLIDEVTPKQVEATLKKHFAKELGWIKELRAGDDRELAEEGREMLEHAARETVVIAEHVPEEMKFHLPAVKAEIALEYWSYQIFEGDDPKAAAAEYKKVRKAMLEVEIGHLKQEMEHIKAEIEELRGEEAEIDAEVEEMLLER